MRCAVRSPRNNARRGLTMIELVVSVLIISIVLVSVGVAVIRATSSYYGSQRATNGHWIASIMMNQLVGEELPTFEDAEGGLRLEDEGSFRDFLEESMSAKIENYTDDELTEFEEWRYRWVKELVVLNEEGDWYPTLEGDQINYGQLEIGEGEGEGSVVNDFRDDATAPESEDDLLDQADSRAGLPGSQMIRITLELWRLKEGQNEGEGPPRTAEDDEEGGGEQNKAHFVLVTFVDSEDFKEDVIPDEEGSGTDNGTAPTN